MRQLTRRAFAAVVIGVSLLVPPVQADIKVYAFCGVADRQFEQIRDDLPIAISTTTTLVHAHLTVDRENDRCTFRGYHQVDTAKAAENLVEVAHRGGQHWVTLADAYQEIGTTRYRQRMLTLMKAQLAEHPLARQLASLPSELRKAIAVDLRYDYLPNDHVSVEPLSLSLGPADLERITNRTP